MALAYYDADSVIRRLDRTICMYRGEPVFVRYPNLRNGMGSEHIVYAYSLPYSEKFTAVDYRAPEFSYKAFPLGYINAGNYASYLSRSPMRQQRQGLHSSVVYCLPDTPREPDWFTSQAMKDCILGVYPNLDTALGSIRTDFVGSVAISRDIAVSRMPGGGVGLHYKGRLVGYKSLYNSTFTLIESQQSDILRDIMKEYVCLK